MAAILLSLTEVTYFFWETKPRSLLAKLKIGSFSRWLVAHVNSLRPDKVWIEGIAHLDSWPFKKQHLSPTYSCKQMDLNSLVVNRYLITVNIRTVTSNRVCLMTIFSFVTEICRFISDLKHLRTSEINQTVHFNLDASKCFTYVQVQTVPPTGYNK